MRFIVLMSRPSSSISPDVGAMSCATVRARVVLPQPDSPTMATVLPLGMLIETPSTAFTTLRSALLKGFRLLRRGKYFFRSLVTSTSLVSFTI